MQNGCPHNISIQDQKLDCQGNLREKRFGKLGEFSQNGKPWDGVHMRGRLAVRHYTNSLIRIVASVFDNNMSGQNYEKGKFERNNYHERCPQTNYQRNYRQFPRQQPQQLQSGGRWNNTLQYNGHNTGFNVPLSNRFNMLGNY